MAVIQQLQMLLVFLLKNTPGNSFINKKNATDRKIRFRTNGYNELADRLIELQYELTDRLICFLGSKRPDHKNEPHIVLPEFNDK